MVLSDKVPLCCSHFHTRKAQCIKRQNNCPTLCCYNRCCISCLYTGDTVLKRGVRKTSKYVDRYETFLKDLQRYTCRVSLMQMPHHGSGNNSNISSLCDCMSLRLFCNYAIADLTTAITMLDLSKLDSVWKTIYSVTEDAKSLFEEKSCFWI